MHATLGSQAHGYSPAVPRPSILALPHSVAHYVCTLLAGCRLASIFVFFSRAAFSDFRVCERLLLCRSRGQEVSRDVTLAFASPPRLLDAPSSPRGVLTCSTALISCLPHLPLLARPRRRCRRLSSLLWLSFFVVRFAVVSPAHSPPTRPSTRSAAGLDPIHCESFHIFPMWYRRGPLNIDKKSFAATWIKEVSSRPS